MLSSTARGAVAVLAVLGIVCALKYPEISTSPEFAVGMNTFSVALFVMCTEESKEFADPHANEPHVLLKSLSNRTVGAMMLWVVVLFTVYSNVRLMQR